MLSNSRNFGLFLASISFVVVIVSLLIAGEPLALVTFVIPLVTFIIVYLVSSLLYKRRQKKEEEALLDLIDSIKRSKFDGEWNHSPYSTMHQEIAMYVKKKKNEIEELKRMADFRKEFIANVSHELKTPIFAAQGFVLTLLDGAVRDKKVRDRFLKKAAKSLDRLDLLVQDLLILSQIETGEIKMVYEDFDVVQLAREVGEQFEEKAEKKGIKLQISDPGAPINVHADWHRIYQVLLNLVSNAIEYTEKGGVKMSFEKSRKSKITIKVTDSGKGIPRDQLPRIFERFYRVDKSRSRAKGGTGLGLAICKHIIEAHKSRIKVISDVGKGSEFSFKLLLVTKEKDEETQHQRDAVV